MFENITKFLKKFKKLENQDNKSKDTAKERLHLVLMQDRANVSVDFLEMMKQEIIEVIKKYIDVDENAIDVRLTNKTNDDGTNGAPALYANIPIISIKDEKKAEINENKAENRKENLGKVEEKQNEEAKKENDESNKGKKFAKKDIEKDNKNDEDEVNNGTNFPEKEEYSSERKEDSTSSEENL